MVFDEPLRQCVEDVKIGQILIQTNSQTEQPEVFTNCSFLSWTFLLVPLSYTSNRDQQRQPRFPNGCYCCNWRGSDDGTSGFDWPQSSARKNHPRYPIGFIYGYAKSVIMKHEGKLGVCNIAYAFPNIKIVAGAIDKEVDSEFHILPGIGNFGICCSLSCLLILVRGSILWYNGRQWRGVSTLTHSDDKLRESIIFKTSFHVFARVTFSGSSSAWFQA